MQSKQACSPAALGRASGIKGNESMPDLIDHAELEQGIGRPNENWSKISKDMKSMLLKLCEPKSQAFLITKREQSGCMAWHEVNKWYMETSGLGATERMTALMNPKQAKRDEDVLTVLEKWEDEMTELRALGASELLYDKL